MLFLSQNSAQKILADVNFIPDLKSNIISLGQATESGCDVRMKDDHLTLHDKGGNLIVKARRSQNRLYKILMDSFSEECFQLSTQRDYNRLHARLGHIGESTMKSMQRN